MAAWNSAAMNKKMIVKHRRGLTLSTFDATMVDIDYRTMIVLRFGAFA